MTYGDTNPDNTSNINYNYNPDQDILLVNEGTFINNNGIINYDDDSIVIKNEDDGIILSNNIILDNYLKKDDTSINFIVDSSGNINIDEDLTFNNNLTIQNNQILNISEGITIFVCSKDSNNTSDIGKN